MPYTTGRPLIYSTSNCKLEKVRTGKIKLISFTNYCCYNDNLFGIWAMCICKEDCS